MFSSLGYLSLKYFTKKKEAKAKQYVFFLYDDDHAKHFTEFPSLAVDNTVKRMKQKRNAMFPPT